MMISRFRMAVRIQRFEVWSCVLLVAVVGITALIVGVRLNGVGAPVECLTPWIVPDVVYDAARCDPLNEAFFRTLNSLTGKSGWKKFGSWDAAKFEAAAAAPHSVRLGTARRWCRGERSAPSNATGRLTR